MKEVLVIGVLDLNKGFKEVTAKQVTTLHHHSRVVINTVQFGSLVFIKSNSKLLGLLPY